MQATAKVIAVVCTALAAAFVGAADESASQRLVVAASEGDPARIAALVREGAAPDARDAAGRPAIVLAARSGRADAVRALLRSGAKPDAGDRSGWTALHQAAASGDLPMARVLLEAGATADLRSRAEGTALDVAERAGRTAVAELLRARGAKGSGKSKGDNVCVRPWRGDGYCGVIEAVEPTRVRLRVSEVAGCERGCSGNETCSGGRNVGPGGLGRDDVLWVPFSCLTHTGLR